MIPHLSKDVVESKPYKCFCIDPIKCECVGHVEKRLGTQLRKKVQAFKGTKTPLSGRNKLTKKTMDSMCHSVSLHVIQR